MRGLNYGASCLIRLRHPWYMGDRADEDQPLPIHTVAALSTYDDLLALLEQLPDSP